MRPHSENQVFTVFGGSYVSENHNFEDAPAATKSSAMKVVAVLGMLMLGITTATAVTKNARMRASDSLFGQNPHAISISVPGSRGFEQAVY